MAHRSLMVACASLFLITVAILPARAQDRRTVTEPTMPPTPYCATLTATLAAPINGVFPDRAEATPPDTARIKAAILACSKISAASAYTVTATVQLAAGSGNVAFLSGPIAMASGVTLLIDPGVTLYASRNAAEYDLNGKCGRLDMSSSGCTNFITASSIKNIAFIGPGTVDGRGYAVVNVSGNTTGYTWWGLATMAQTAGLNQNNPRLFQINSTTNTIFYKINLHNSPKFHVATTKATGFTSWGVSILAPPDARNTDAFDPSGTDFTIVNSYLSAGDDDVAIKGGNVDAAYMTIAHDHLYRGHGMSIGSETNAGVDHIQIFDITMDGTDNGIRIKSDSSRGGTVSANYSNFCMRNIVNPLVFSAYYSSSTGALYPNFNSIHLQDIHSGPPTGSIASQGGPNLPLVFQGYGPAYPLIISLDNVIVDGVDPSQIFASDALITKGPGPVNFTPVGNDVATYDQTSPNTTALPVDCSTRFVPFVSIAKMCDVDGNGTIDRNDINAILAARGTAVGIYDPRDPDGSGQVTVLDARQCALQCTKPGCAP